MEVAQQPVDEARGRQFSLGDIFWKARVVGGGEAPAILLARASRGETKRPFRGDVNAIGSVLPDEFRKPSSRRQRQPDFRIGWHRNVRNM